MSSSVTLPATNVIEKVSGDADTCISLHTSPCVHAIGVQMTAVVMIIFHYRTTTHTTLRVTAVRQMIATPDDIATVTAIEALRWRVGFFLVPWITADLSGNSRHWVFILKAHPVRHSGIQ